MDSSLSQQPSIDIKVGRDISGLMNLGTINGHVTNTINQLPESADPNKPSLKELLTQLQAAIESEPELPDEDKAEALKQVPILAEAAQKPKDSTMHRAAKNALTFLKGTTVGMSETTKLVKECSNLLPAITALLSLV